MAAVGAKVPAATLYENTPGGAVTTDELFSKKRVVIFGVPGAFTPGCSKTHLPGASVRGGGRGAVMPFVYTARMRSEILRVSVSGDCTPHVVTLTHCRRGWRMGGR